MRSRLTRHKQNGFTLVEMIIVYTILFILVALLLPSVQHSREQARRHMCRNNLSQIGVALRSYDSIHSVLPPGVVNHSGPIQSVEDEKQLHINWISMILPQLERRNCYREQDFSLSVYNEKHASLRDVYFPFLHCSSTWRSNTKIQLSTYSGVHHHQEAPIDSDNSGVLFLNSSVDLDDIPDGAGNTMLVAEKDNPASDLGWMSGTRSTLRNTGTSIMKSEGEYGNPYQTNLSQNQTLTAEEQLSVGGFHSQHFGGHHALFADGRVEFLTTQLNQAVHERMGNRHDGELIGDF